MPRHSSTPTDPVTVSGDGTLPAVTLTAPDDRALTERFEPIFARIAEGASTRDAERRLPVTEIRELADAGFGAVRVPVEHGGLGATLPQLFELLTALAAADPNITQALRGHFAFVEDRLVAAPGLDRERWLRRFVGGELVGNAWTEVGDVKLGEVGTTVSPRPDLGAGRFTVNGQKYYSTGSIFADWIDTYAERTDTGQRVIAAVSTHQEGVILQDDWDGFGQRTTGTGTTSYVDAEVLEEDIVDFDTRFKYQTAFYQVVLLAVLAGSARAAERDVAAALAGRRRSFSHGAAAIAAEDPQLLQVIGEVAGAGFAGEAVVRRAAQFLQGSYEAALGRGEGTVTAEEEERRNDEAELASAEGQVALTRLVTASISNAFDALSASSTSSTKNLDRHWRNARTAATHNPWVYKARLVGDRSVNGAALPRVWAIGATS
ncbi:acyl-CoA dehydrogenase family protein [Citricoccus sp. NPDC055426]|uniref:acyl-CoA dehydrogenase family protein n=1 Tax=Citricoccus sp. NPDC055426 TaxID=3155536 RepID=UPI00343025E8